MLRRMLNTPECVPLGGYESKTQPQQILSAALLALTILAALKTEMFTFFFSMERSKRTGSCESQQQSVTLMGWWVRNLCELSPPKP